MTRQSNRLVGIADLCEGDTASVGINYTNAVILGGDIPVVLPYTGNISAIKDMISRIDVLLLAGGCDIDPSFFGEAPSPMIGDVNLRRDKFEFALLEEAVHQNKPVFGICRGIQVINVYFGGTLYQDLPTELPASEINHQRPDMKWDAVHEIRIATDSELYRILGVERVGVNSTHHQSVKAIAPGFTATAWAEDGVVEAIESTDYPIIAVQFHPERLVKDSRFHALF